MVTRFALVALGMMLAGVTAPPSAMELDCNENGVADAEDTARGPFRLIGPHIALGGDLLATADFDGDGHEDLLTRGLGVFEMTIHLGNGDATFSSLPAFETDLWSVSRATAEDFDGDGELDLAVGHADGFAVFWSVGRQTELTAETVTMPERAGRIFMSLDDDVNGTPDLMSRDNGILTLVRGNGDRTFHVDRFKTPEPTGSFVTGDFDGNGAPDFAGKWSGQEFVALFLNQTVLPTSPDCDGDGVPPTSASSQNRPIRM